MFAGYYSHLAGTGRESPNWGPGASGAWEVYAAYSLVNASYSVAVAVATTQAPHMSPLPLGATTWAPVECDRTRGN